MTNTELFSKLFEEDMENFLKTLTKLTQARKLFWNCKEYIPITIIEDDIDAFLSHGFRAETLLNDTIFILDLYEDINLPSEKGDISGSISYTNEYGFHNYNFALSYDAKYINCCAKDIINTLSDSPIITFSNSIITALAKSETVISEFSYTLYSLLESTTWSSSSLVQLGKKLAQQNNAYSFHTIILNVPLRKQLYKKYNIINVK